MWIRTQDKLGMYRVDSVIVEIDCSGVSIITWHSGDWQGLGDYTDEAEALKVLDLIQGQHDMDVYEHGPEGMRVFQMPPKGFSKAGGDNHGTD